MMLKVFDKIELDSELNDIEDEENPFLMGEDESDEEEYDMIPDYISDYKEQEEPTNAGTQKKTYSIGRIMKTHLRDLYDDHYGDHIDKQDENGESEQEQPINDNDVSLPDILSDNRDELSNIPTQTLLNPLSNPLRNSHNSHHSIHSASNNSNKNNLPDDSDNNGNNDSNNNDDDFKRLCYLKMSSQVLETPILSYPDRQPAS